jgi:hypothetical protein
MLPVSSKDVKEPQVINLKFENKNELEWGYGPNPKYLPQCLHVPVRITAIVLIIFIISLDVRCSTLLQKQQTDRMIRRATLVYTVNCPLSEVLCEECWIGKASTWSVWCSLHSL